MHIAAEFGELVGNGADDLVSPSQRGFSGLIHELRPVREPEDEMVVLPRNDYCPVCLPCGRRREKDNVFHRFAFAQDRIAQRTHTVGIEGLEKYIDELLADIQKGIYDKALAFRTANIRKCDDWEEFKTEIQKGGFLLCHWDGTAETEQKIKDETKATIRCIPVDSCVCEEEGKCIYSGKPSSRRVVFAISY